MSFRGRGRGSYGNSSPRGNFRNGNENVGNHQAFGGNRAPATSTLNNFTQQNMIRIEVWGWNNASPADLVSFLSRKTRISLLNHSVNESNGAVVGYVRSQKDADSLLNWNGVKFAGQSLKFSASGSGTNGSGSNGAGLSSTTVSTVESLKEFLRARYNPAMKMLDLSNMQNDQFLTSRGLLGTTTTSSTSSKMLMAMMKLASEDSSMVVETVNFSNNSVTDTFHSLSLLGTTFPQLLNLSLEGNRISRTKYFESWKSKFSNLRELVLINNPVTQQTTNYQFELMRIFPKLILLDGHLLRDEEKLKKIFKFPVITKQMFFETPDIQNISTSFIANYLKFWDSSRQDLLALYQPESQFSLQVDTSHPAHFHQEDAQYWSYYIPNSRNLTRISNERSRLARLHKGQQDIYKVFQQLPKTKHSLLESPGLFSMESYSYPQVNGIIVTLHGEFEEVGIPEVAPAPGGPRNFQNRYNNTAKGTLTKRSFDRTFIVVQGADQSMIIASDLLLLRSHGGESAWTESPAQQGVPPAPAHPTPVTPGHQGPHQIPGINSSQPVSASPQNNNTMMLLQQQVPPEILQSLSPVQQQLLAKIFEETRLNAEFSLMLCQQSDWNYQNCINSFNGSKGNIPLSAYQQ